MPKHSFCHFIGSLEEKNKVIGFITNIASNFVMSNQNISPEEYFNERVKIGKVDLSEDENILLYLEFLNLINLPVDVIEQKYLDSIFELEDEDAMVDHLADFVEHAII